MAQIHIVLATYNGEAFLREQLESILANDFQDIKIEICDDGSTDGTIQIAEEYEKQYEFISLHRNEKNLGYVMNFMAGIQRSESPYVMLCDQDDIWHSDKIRKTFERMKELEQKEGEQKPLLVFTDAMNFEHESGKELGKFHESSHLDATKTDTAHLFMENKCIGCSIMVNGAIRDYLGELPKEIRVHDWWLALICSHFGKISYLDESTLQYRQHNGNMIGGSGFFAYVKKRIGNLKEQRAAVVATYEQGKAFYDMFGKQLPKEKAECASCFAKMKEAGFIKRRIWLIKYGYWKSGMVRNIALFFMI